ncbi:hypothetical protein LUZ60_000745 [Juncus effusus]|nr:hypothetical protein LUZ60_000745 [Juncus effusus]
MHSLKTPSCTLLIIIILPLALICTIYFIPYPNYFQIRFFSQAGPSTSVSDPNPEFKIFIGIHTIPEKYKRRHLIRMIYSLQQPFLYAKVDIRFILCNLTTDEQKEFIGIEILTHRDIIILNCKENMDKGKTYTYFSTLPKIFQHDEKPYDYVMKLDDDTYLRFDNFIESLRGKPKEDMYWGGSMPNLDQEFPPFMVGTGYILSWDLVEWIATSEIPRNDPNGPEDLYTGMWLNVGGKGKNRYNMGARIYNFKGTEDEDFLPDTIAVHYLKREFMWMATLKHFNVTGALEPSSFYHL